MAHSPRSRAADGLRALPRPVWLLGWVSLATDAASEAIYPLLPFFLTQVLGASAISLGVVEGAAEAANSLLKILSGRASDRRSSRRPLVLAGYAISSLVRPLIAVAQSWPHVLSIRLIDRVGKGLRGAPRDAMLAAWATPAARGKVYGFHRGMDHTGAVIGPTLAALFLFLYPGAYRTLFALTIVPGAIAVLLVLLVREDGERSPSGLHPRHAAPGLQPPPADLEGGAALPRDLKRFLAVLTVFTLGNSTDAFLLLRITEVAGTAQHIPLVWAALHVVKAGMSLVGGTWSDRIGRRAVIAIGWVVYATVYVGFALSSALWALVAWFLVYGFYFGLTEGTEKALVADLAPVRARGFAFGVYNAVLGLGSLLASVFFGLLWSAFGPAVAFATGAALSLAATALLFIVVRR
jgi:MFS family permease